jgi:hypothetical protein
MAGTVFCYCANDLCNNPDSKLADPKAYGYTQQVMLSEGMMFAISNFPCLSNYNNVVL